MSGTNSSHTPLLPSDRIGCDAPFQPLKSPTTRMPRALGAHTAKATPVTRLVRADVRAEDLPELLVPALADQVQVDLAEGRQEPVGVVGRVGRAVVGHVEPVVAHRAVDAVPSQMPKPRWVSSTRSVADDRDDLLGAGAQRADDRALAVRVHAEDAVRVVVRAPGEPVELGVRPMCHHLRSSAFVAAAHATSRSIDPSGTGSQVGRLRAS